MDSRQTSLDLLGMIPDHYSRQAHNKLKVDFRQTVILLHNKLNYLPVFSCYPVFSLVPHILSIRNFILLFIAIDMHAIVHSQFSICILLYCRNYSLIAYCQFASLFCCSSQLICTQLSTRNSQFSFCCTAAIIY